MIGGLVLSYFAEGLYQLLFLFIFGGVIPLYNPTLMIATGVGVKNTKMCIRDSLFKAARCLLEEVRRKRGC